MQREQMDKIVKDIAKIAENLHDPFVHGSRRSRVIARGSIACSITDEYLDLWDAILKEILIKYKLSEKFSEKYIDIRLQEIIVQIIKDGNSENTSEYFNQLIDEYEQYSKEHTLYIPLFGIELNDEPIKLGKVVLKKMDDRNIEELLSLLKLAISKTLNTEDEKLWFFERQLKNIDKFIKNRVCAAITIAAEPDRALEIAENEAQRTIDLLRYAIPALYSAEKRVGIGLQGEYSRQVRYTPIVAIDGSSFSSKGSVVGSLFALELSTSNVEKMRKMGVFALGDLFEKVQLSNFEETLLQGIEWFSRAQTQFEPKNKLLNLITVLETFLTPGGSDPIQKSIAEGTAILLEDDVLHRKKLIKQIKVFYGLRSKLSHGHGKVILDADVNALSNISGSLIMILTEQKDRFESKDELLDWIEYTKLGGLPENWDKYKASI